MDGLDGRDRRSHRNPALRAGLADHAAELVAAEPHRPVGERPRELRVHGDRLAEDEPALGDARLHTADVDDHLVGPRHRIRHLLDDQLPEPVQDGRAHV
jgi:hypothetical protein